MKHDKLETAQRSGYKGVSETINVADTFFRSTCSCRGLAWERQNGSIAGRLDNKKER